MVSSQQESVRWMRPVGSVCALAVAGLVAMPQSATAQSAPEDMSGESPAMPTSPVIEDVTSPKVSGTIGVDYNSHFVSYGFDVWGAGNDFYGDEATLNPYAEVGFDFDTFTLTVGSWWDINDNAAATIGGDIQEQDVYYSLGTSYEDFSFGLTFQHWHYGGGVEQVLDFSVGYDDSALWGGEFALNPSLLVHKRLSSTNIGGDTNGYAFLIGVEPAFTVVESDEYPIDMAVPVTVAFGDDKFYPDSGFAYFSVGAQFSVPLAFIPAEYGEWAFGAGVTFYSTDVGNAEDDFLAGNVGVAMSF